MADAMDLSDLLQRLRSAQAACRDADALAEESGARVAAWAGAARGAFLRLDATGRASTEGAGVASLADRADRGAPFDGVTADGCAFLCAPVMRGGEAEAALLLTAPAGHDWSSVRAPITEVAWAAWQPVARHSAEAAARDATPPERRLLFEMQHRVRNILAVVRSVFARTVNDAIGRDDAITHFTGRLDALARTQALVTGSWSGLVDIEELVRDEMLAIGSADDPRIAISGPDVALPARIAEPVGLAIHELTTNAVKFGALQSGLGSLQICWYVNVDRKHGRRLTLDWQERGVPAMLSSPRHRGFGSELIEEALRYQLGAETSLDFRGGGVRCSIIVPLPEEGTSTATT